MSGRGYGRGRGRDGGGRGRGGAARGRGGGGGADADAPDFSSGKFSYFILERGKRRQHCSIPAIEVSVKSIIQICG